MAFFTVIIPNYNHAAYLEQRIASVLNQSFRDFDVILLDDASTDDSRQIIESYKQHPKIKRVDYNSMNSGSPFRQWKKGIDYADSDWIWIAESDDYCEPDFLENCFRIINENPNVVLVVARTARVNENGESELEENSFLNEGLQKGMQVLRDKMIYENAIKNASAVVFSKKILDERDLSLITRYRWCGDWALWSILCTRGDLFFINKTLNYFRRHQKDSSRSLYSQGYLYKEGLSLSLFYQRKLQINSNTRRKAFMVWATHLFNQYREHFKKGQFRFYLFRPLYYCFLMHLALPVIAIKRFLGEKTRA